MTSPGAPWTAAAVALGSNLADPVAHVRATLEASVRAKAAVAAQLAEPIARAGDWVAACYRAGGKTLLFGSGGSAADAQHLAAEWTGKLGPDRKALPSLALTANTSDLTAIGNDYGFERVFSRLIEAHGRAGDVAIPISTSGNSPNVIESVEEKSQHRTVAGVSQGDERKQTTDEVSKQ